MFVIRKKYSPRLWGFDCSWQHEKALNDASVATSLFVSQGSQKDSTILSNKQSVHANNLLVTFFIHIMVRTLSEKDISSQKLNSIFISSSWDWTFFPRKKRCIYLSDLTFLQREVMPKAQDKLEWVRPGTALNYTRATICFLQNQEREIMKSETVLGVDTTLLLFQVKMMSACVSLEFSRNCFFFSKCK